MNDLERAVLPLKIELEWKKTTDAYHEAGVPFGDGRGVELWAEFGQQTTVN